MKEFAGYVRRLQSLAQHASTLLSEKGGCRQIDAALDGEPSSHLRRVVPLEQLRTSGAFFTGGRLARSAIAHILAKAPKDAIFLDPACGAGDLLISCARELGVSRSYGATITQWGNSIAGIDLHTEFIRATKLRLALLALNRVAKRENVDPSAIDAAFPKIRVGDGLLLGLPGGRPLCIVLNPPFTAVGAPDGCPWAQGSVSLAALFVERYVLTAPEGTRIASILPEVLRTGTRYEKWRSMLQQGAEIERCRVFGRFAPWADIDVFFLDLLVRPSNRRFRRNWWQGRNEQNISKIGDYCEVHVGSVVPHRDPKQGPCRPYIQSRLLARTRLVDAIEQRREFAGCVFTPPLVLVRRTSRPGDKPRASATIVTGKEPIAVENHLIALLPRAGTLAACHAIADVLESPKTTAWLDSRIRCRHLTVSALREIPWWKDEA